MNIHIDKLATVSRKFSESQYFPSSNGTQQDYNYYTGVMESVL